MEVIESVVAVAVVSVVVAAAGRSAMPPATATANGFIMRAAAAI